MDGYLLIDKPTGLTSHDVVARVRRILRQSGSKKLIVNSKKLSTNNSQLTTREPKGRVGHTGTLDPLASGLLILVLGNYTKRADEFSKLDKTYEVELILGATSITGDIEGEIRPKSAQKPTKEATGTALSTFLGEIMQIPHIYSAIKVGGQRAYKLARKGEKPKIEPRKVTIYSIEEVRYEYPKVWFTARVSSGTYVRSLAEDIGEKLGTGAYVSALRRTKVGDFDVKDAITIDSLSINTVQTEVAKK